MGGKKKKEREIITKNPKGTEQPFIFWFRNTVFFVYMTTPEFEAIRWG